MRLLGEEKVGALTERWWLHTGDDGKDRITVQTVEDVESVLDANRRAYNDAPQAFGRGAFHKVASIPEVVIGEVCRIHAERWGCGQAEVFRELMTNKTDRAQRVWRNLLNAQEFRAFRTRPGRVDMR
jgi:hypothetical protein